jgi:hypothetical protein
MTGVLNDLLLFSCLAALSTKLDETLEAKAGHTTPYKPANLTTIQTASR